jgi:hypothetical protein
MQFGGPVYNLRAFQLWLDRAPTNADLILVVAVAALLVVAAMVGRRPRGRYHTRRRSGCPACEGYRPAFGSQPAARCGNCGRRVRDEGQFFTPDRRPMDKGPHG